MFKRKGVSVNRKKKQIIHDYIKSSTNYYINNKENIVVIKK